MNKNKYGTDFFDFNIRYDQEKDKRKSINTVTLLEKKEELQQFYTGLYYEKCYHNTGRYKWINDNEEYVYEGKLYANNLHGYGRLIYPDKSTYEGLFYHNKRFGPGVITYSEQQQDVGLWDGKYLVRISQYIDLADFYLESIPNIAKSLEGKLYLLKFKKVVPIVDKNDPVAKLVKKLKMKEEDGQLLYSKCVRNHKSIFMNHSLFDRNFYTDPNELVVDVVDYFDENKEPVISKVTATNLLAWSNEQLYISIMKHTFMNRKYEKILNFKIRNTFLPNKRHTFMPEGPIERKCLKLLAACRDDDTVEIAKLISDYDLYPNVSDCYGNSTIVYAAMTNKRNAIKTLVNLGASINGTNDECVSALMLCILHYIAIKNDILEDKWELSFLKTSPGESLSIGGRMWPTGSTSTIFDNETKESKSSTSKTDSVCKFKTKKQQKMMKNKMKKDKLINQMYIFNLIYKAPVRKILPKGNLRGKKRTSQKTCQKTIECGKSNALDSIIKTIYTLVQCGADVNSCEVPFPPLVSALFSENVDLIQLLLESKVNVNRQTRRETGSLNPLHIVCAMEKSENQVIIMDRLLTYGADVNARSDITHWPDVRDQLLAGDMLEFGDAELGKTPFHVLALSQDFEEDTGNRIIQMAKMLVENGANANDQYLGHNVLSLAALRGNDTLIEYVLYNNLSDPNGSLGYNMGVPLTMLTLRKYCKNLPLNKLAKMFETLVKYNANPFNEVPGFDGNAIEFASACDAQTMHGAKVNIGLKMLQALSDSILRRYIDSHAFQLIYSSIIQQNENNPIISNAVKYLNFSKAITILQILLDNKKIPSNYELCIQVLNFILPRTQRGKLHAYLIDKSEFGKDELLEPIKKKILRKSIAENFDRTKSYVQIKHKQNFYLLDFGREDNTDLIENNIENLPEIDENHDKYIVCYECLQRAYKKLQLCPYCTLAYFCSLYCNLKKNESGEHPCKKAFYIESKDNLLRRKTAIYQLRRETLLAQDSKGRLRNFKGKFYRSSSDSDDSDTSSSSTRKSKKKSRKKKRGSYEEEEEEEEEENKKKKRKRKKRRTKKNRLMRRSKWFLLNSRIIIRREKKICTEPCKGKLIAIEFKEPLEEVERKMREKFKPPELKFLRRIWSNKMKCTFPINARNIHLMLRVARRVNLQLVPVTDSDLVTDPCNPFDYKFWQLFLPYCVFQNGELFYRSDEGDLLYKFNYKTI